MKLVIGIVGPPLAGKETCADELEALLRKDGYSVSRHRFSDILRETLTLWGLPHGREHEQLLAQLMDKFQKGTLSFAVRNKFLKDTADVGILDGMRWISDEKMVRGFGEAGIKNIIVSIAASQDRRYERLKKRARSGEETVTREKFDEQMRAENEIYIPDIGSRAEVKLINDYDAVADLKKDIATAYREKIKPLL